VGRKKTANKKKNQAPPRREEPARKARRLDRRVFVSSLNDLAIIFGKSARDIEQWSRNGAPTKTAEGYDLREWLAWYIARITGSNGDDLDRRLKAVRVGRQELAFAKDQGRVIDATEAEARQMAIIDWMVAVFERLPAELSPRLPGKTSENRRILKAHCDRIRTEAASKR